MTAIKPDRRSCARGGRYAIGVVCLVVGLCCTGCGKKQESSRTEPTTVDAASSRGKGAARPAGKAPRPVAAVEQPAPAPAEPAAEVVAQKPKVVVNESVVVARKPAPPAERTETLEQIIDATVEEPVVVAEEPARVVAVRPVETPLIEAVEPVSSPEPESAPDHAGLARAAMKQGDCEKALEHFHYARQESPDDLDLRLNEAEMYRQCGWPDVTLELLSELDARSRSLEPVVAEIAEAHRMLNEPGRAAMAWELRYIHHPKAWRAAAQAAEAWMEAGQYKPAQWWFEQARLAAPNTPEVQALTTVIQSAAVTNR